MQIMMTLNDVSVTNKPMMASFNFVKFRRFIKTIVKMHAYIFIHQGLKIFSQSRRFLIIPRKCGNHRLEDMKMETGLVKILDQQRGT